MLDTFSSAALGQTLRLYRLRLLEAVGGEDRHFGHAAVSAMGFEQGRRGTAVAP